MITFKPKHPFFYLGADILVLYIAFFISLYFFKGHKFAKLEWSILSGFIFFAFVLEYWRTLHYSGLDDEFRKLVFNHLIACFSFVVLVCLFHLPFPVPITNKSEAIGIAIGISVLDITMTLLMVKLKYLLKKAKEKTKYTLIAGTGHVAKHVGEQLYAHRVTGYELKGFINCRSNEECAVGQERVVGDLNDMQQYLTENPVDEIVIALPVKYSKKIQNILSAADYHGIRVKYILDYQEIFGKNYKLTRYGQIDAINIRQLPVDGQYPSFVKNCFDKVFSAVILILLAPLFLVLAALIKLDSPGPVFYCPIRIGKGGKPFKVFKFRSMRENDTTSGGTLSTQEDDPRITRLGHVLRKYSLDELPQFINVFIGNMSVVGPRPHRRYLNRQLQESVYKYMIRHYVKPGITGWAQVNGWRGPTNTDEQKRQRTLHDLWYIENWSLWLDIKIILRTIFSKKAHKNAF